MNELYTSLVPWYALLDALEDHADEAELVLPAFARAADAPLSSLLELGSGAGHNAYYMKGAFASCTLSDLSEAMLDLSRTLNPECEHVQGDMRGLRLGRTFDLVYIHDAICYMASEADLTAAIETAYIHTRPGGAAIFAPDCLRETFVGATDDHEGSDGERSLRAVEWMWDPDPQDSHYTVDYAFLLRDTSGVRAVHDRHIEGLFSRATWIRILSTAGYQVELLPRPVSPEDNPGGAYCEEVFLCKRP
ncbi:MAG: class I SAM-dependent methyltransferase [Proteobacteria bacterium]|nr:class I SAM-dependent methyltransferase [Pseudomonadota bacterium]